MWSDVIVLFDPFFDDDPGLFDCREPFGIEDLAPERAVEALVVAVLPR